MVHLLPHTSVVTQKRHIRLLHLVVCVVFCVSTQTAYAQAQRLDKKLVFKKISVDDGLPQGWVTQLVQDKQGFIWVASKGLSRYDGVSFKTWQHVYGDSSSLHDNGILTIDTDNNNNFWLGYLNYQFDVFNTITSKVRHISAEPAFRWLKITDTRGYFIRQLGYSYFYGSTTHLVAFNPQTGSHTIISLPLGEQITSTGADNQGNAYVSTLQSLYKVANNQLVKLAALPPVTAGDTGQLNFVEAKAGYQIGMLLPDWQGNTVIPALGGVYLYNKTTNTVKYAGSRDTADIASTLTVSGNSLRYVEGSNLYEVDKHLTAQPVFNLANGFNLNHPIIIDKTGTLWCGTTNGTGVYAFNLQNSGFTSYPYKHVFSKDVLQPWVHTEVDDHGFSSYVMRSATDVQGNTWVTYPGLTLSAATGNAADTDQVVIKPNIHGYTAARFKGCEVDQLTFDASGRCWMVVNKRNSHAKTIVEANLANGTLRPFADLPNTADYLNNVSQYLTASGNKLCEVAQSELRVYDVATAKCTVYSAASLGVENILLMAATTARFPGMLWLATQGAGIISLNLANGAVRHYNPANGLPDGTAYFIAPDSHGYFWCSSNKGIFRFNPADGSSMLFTAKDGLQGNEFNRYHFLQTPDGHFIFGGTNGYTVFYPDSVFVDSYQVPSAITQISVNNNTWSQPIVDNKLTLEYDQNLLSFSFAGLEYNPPARLQYRYTLENYDKQWVIADGYTATYNSIPPGHYVFKVNATNIAGIWSKLTGILYVTILPPWYKTWWAYTLYALVLCAMLYALYRNWLNNVTARQQVMLKEKEAQQLKAVDEMKSRFFSNITHEFRTPLSLILGPANQMLNEEPTDGWKKYAGTIQRNAGQVLGLINQLMDMAKLEANSMKMSLYRGSFHQFITDQVESFRQAASAKNIALVLENEMAEEDYLFDADKLHTILSNILANAIKFTPEGGTVTVRCITAASDTTGLTASIAVEDTGPGILPEKLPFIFNRFYQAEDSGTRKYGGTGIGLALAKELAILLCGTLEAASEWGKGSTFTLQFRLAYANGEDLPLYTPVVAALPVTPTTATTNPAPILNYKATILVVEDNYELREFISEIFSQQYRVLTANNGSSGFDIAKDELPDVIISDLMMPGMDGYDFCKAVKTNAATDHIAFILLTAKTSKLSMIEGLHTQADDYLTKPFLVEELYLRVNNLLTRQQVLKEHFQQALAQPNTTTKSTNPFLENLYAIIEKNLSDPLFSIDQLASATAVSTRTLNRKLASLLGMPPSELLKQYRLKKAAVFLQQGHNVAETAYEVGYESPAYFSTAFKGHFGVAPSEYRIP